MRTRSLLALLLLPAACGAQVANPDFSAGPQDWGFSLDAGAGGFVDWDANVGDPAAGSARAGNVFIGDRVDGWRQCVPVSGADFAFSVAVASALQTGNSCRIKFDFIAIPDCVNGTPIALEVTANNTRNDGTFETLAGGGALPPGIQAAAVSLDHVRVAAAAAGDSFCHFDHVELRADTLFMANFE